MKPTSRPSKRIPWFSPLESRHNVSLKRSQGLAASIASGLRLGAMLGSVLLAVMAPAATVQHLNTQTATASGSGATGTPSIASFSIPAGKNRVLFIWAGFERDHISVADASGGLGTNSNTAGTGLGDNYPEPRIGTPPATTTNNQLTARVVGSGGSIDKKNALVIGGTPSGDTRFIGISTSPTGSPAGTAFFGIHNYHIVLFENEIKTLLGSAASGTVTITLPDTSTPSNAGDDAFIVASVFQNVDQTVNGFVRNATATAQVTTGTPGNSNLAPAAYDAGQAPDEADDGKLVLGTNSSTEGFTLPAGHTALTTVSITNAGGQYDTPNGNINNEPNGLTAGAYFRNGGATPGSLYTLQMAGAAATLTYGATNASFLLESDNADTSDAPASYGNATHTVSGIRLGASVDADSSSLNNSTATGDDVNNTDDEDGVTIPAALARGVTQVIPVSIQNAAGRLNAWIDWNADGDFDDAGEQIVNDQAVAVGTVNVSVNVPAGATLGASFARFRVSTNAGECNTPASATTSGEVEDYAVTIATPSTNADLSALSTTAGSISFAAATTSYSVNVVNATATTTVTATTADSTATLQVQVNGGGYTALTSGVASAALNLNVGANPIDVKVTAQDGTTIKTYTITVTRAGAGPTVSSVSPSVAGSGTSVTITGTGFTGASSVTIGGVAVTSFTVVNDTTITTTVPAGVNGLVNVVVTTAGGPGTGTNLLSVVDYLVTTTATTITCTDASGNSDTLTVRNVSGLNIKFSAPGRTFSVDGAAAITGDSGTINRAGKTSITINGGAGDDVIDIGGLGGMPSLTINGGTGDDTVTFSSSIVFTASASVDVNLQNDDPTPGSDRITFATNAALTCASGATGSFTFKCSRDIQLDPGATISIGSGTLTLEANQQTTPSTGDFAGIYADGATLTTDGSGGSIVLKGRGGNGGAVAATPNAGIHLLGNSTVTSGGFFASGAVTMVGTSGVGGDHAAGVFFEDTTVDAYSGDVTITGTAVGTVAGAFQRGIDIGGSSGTYISAYGPGLVTFIGAGAPASSGSTSLQGNDGVFIEAFSAVYSEDGDINITGTGGQGTAATVGQDWQGVQIFGDVNSTGVGNIAITGTAGITSTNNHGIFISSASHSSGTSVVTAAGGTVTLTGSTTSTAGYGLWLDSNGGNVVDATGSGTDITLIADTMNLLDTTATGEPVLKTSGAGIATLKPLTGVVNVWLGSADFPGGALGLTSAELNLVSTGHLVIGSSTSGPVYLNNSITLGTPTSVRLVSGRAVAFYGGTFTNLGANVEISPGPGYAFSSFSTATDIDTFGPPTPGTLSITGSGLLGVAIQSSTVYDTLKVKGNVSLSGVNLALYDYSGGSYTPSAAQSFTIIDKVDAGSITGTFNGLAEGATVSVNGVNKTLTYVGGDGNDVVLLGVAAPAPTVTSSTANLLANATTLTITGTNFDAVTPGNNTVAFTPTGTGTVTAATATSLTVSVSGLRAGALNAVVTNGAGNSGAAVQVATVIPVITSSTASIAISATTLTINGFGFDNTNFANNSVVFSPAGTGNVVGSLASSINVTGIAGLTPGALFAVVTVNGVASASTQVATVVALPPTVTTATQSGVTTSSAVLGGTVTADGGAPVTERGIVWSTNANPTIADTKVANGSGTGAFSGTVSGLPSNTTLHVRAYATSIGGTGYGGDISFATLQPLPGGNLKLTYGGAGTALTLTETSVGSDTVSVSTPAANTLRIHLNGRGFDSTSSLTGVTYENAGSPDASTYADISVAAAGAISALSIHLGTGTDTLNFGPTLAAGIVTTGISLTATGTVTLSGSFTAPAVDATSSAGSIVQSAGVVTAASLALSASTGVGTGVASRISTVVSNFEAQTSTGGIFIANTGNLSIGGVSAGLSGVRVATSGAIDLVNTSGNVRVVTPGDLVKAPGNVSIKTVTSGNIVTANNNGFAFGSFAGSVNSTGAGVTLDAAGDIDLGETAAGNVNGDVMSAGNLLLRAAGNVFIDDQASAQVTGPSVTLTITAGGNISMLHTHAAGSIITNQNLSGGLISITTGTGGTFTLDGGTANPGLYSGSSGTVITADSMVLPDDIVFNGGGVTLKTATAGRAIDVGTKTVGKLGLTNAELGLITASTLNIGDATSGPVTVSAAITRSSALNVTLNSGDTVALNVGPFNTAGGNLTLNPGGVTNSFAPSASGIDAALGSNGTLSFGSGDKLAIAISSTVPDTGFTQLKVTGKVNLTGAVLALSGSYVPSLADSFVIIDNDGTDAITGTFSSLPEGTVLNFNGVDRLITYLGGDGNDVALIRPLPEIAVSGNATNIVDGDTTPNTLDHTDFGSAVVTGGTVVRTFTISNSGPGVLNLTGAPKVVVSGLDAADFMVTTPPTSAVAATTGTTTFQVTFDPSASGVRTATLSIANDDSDENPFDFAIQGTGIGTQPVNTGALGDVTTNASSPDATGASDTTQFNVLGRGGYLAANGTLGFPGTLKTGGAVTSLNNQGYWKDTGTGLKRLVRSSDVMLGTGGASLDALPTIPVPGLNSIGQVTLLGALRIGTGTVPVTASDDTAMWSEVGGSGLHLLARENDPVTGVSGAFIDSFGFGCYATATTGVGTGEAAFTVKMKGSTTQTALIRRSITGPGVGSNVIIAREGSAAPGVAGQNFGAMNSALTNAVRMDPTGNLVFEAQMKPNNKFGIWYQPIGGSVSKVFVANDTAPGTSNATFGSFDLPSMGSGGTFAFHAVLNRDGDNATNAKNSGIWRGTGTGAFTPILRRGDPALPGMVVGAKVGNLWNGWLNLANHGAWKGWVDTAGDGISPYPADTFGIYTDVGGTMRLLISAGDAAPGIAGATMATIDHPVVSGNTVGSEYVAFLGTVTGGGVTAGTNDKGLWRSTNGSAPTLILRTGDSMTTSQGSKTVFNVDIPGSGQDVRPWEQSVMDDTGRILIIVTFTDGSTSQVIAQ